MEGIRRESIRMESIPASSPFPHTTTTLRHWFFIMRIMVFRRVSLVAAVLLGMLVLLGAAPAAGASESARVSLDVAEPLTSVDDPVEITVRGFVDEIWVDAEIQVMVYGPGRPGDETGAE